MCENISFSVNYFSVLFGREIGEGFTEYLTRIRVGEAKTSLHEASIPTTEIYEKVGRSDRKHSTYTFHKTTGLNLVECRKPYG